MILWGMKIVNIVSNVAIVAIFIPALRHKESYMYILFR